MSNRRSSSRQPGLGTSVRRRGSVDQYDDSATVSSAQLTCPRCRQLFETPLIMPCNHRVCKRCVEQMFNRRKNSYFHCPVRDCNSICATDPQDIRIDRDLRGKVRQFRSNQDRDRLEVRQITCQRANCNLEARSNDPCPHCQLILCQEHFDEDGQLVKNSCYDWLKIKSKETLSSVRDCIEDHKLQKNNIKSQIKDNKQTHEQLIECLNEQFRNMQKELRDSLTNIKLGEKRLKILYQRLCDLQAEMENALSTEEDTDTTFEDKWKIFSEADGLTSHFEIPKRPEDVHFNYTSTDIDAINEKIKELRVINASLEVRVCEKRLIKYPDEEFRPHQAVIWSHTDDFQISRENFVERRKTSEFVNEKLPDEVLIVYDTSKANVVSFDGEILGQIRIYDGNTSGKCTYICISPNGRQLIMQFLRKILLCDMDGTVLKQIEPDYNKIGNLHGLCTVALSENNLMIVAPGNTRYHKPGAVFVAEGPDFDFHQAKRIPLDRRRIYPTGITQVRGSFIVLANRTSVNAHEEVDSNELLMYDRWSCEFIAELPCSQEIKSALYICSDDIGRVFVSVTRNRSGAEARSSSDPPAEVIVLDPLGHQIGSIGAEDGLAMCSGISISDSRARTGRPNRLVVCDATQRLVLVYTLG